MTMNIEYPRIHLAVDNCFAIKRWVEPADWMRVINEIGGLKYIEASTDNEIDPLHNTQAFRDNWIREVKKYESIYDLKVFSFYSGYATYRSTGIASLFDSKRTVIIDDYFKPVVDIASQLGAQVGNTLSAISDPVLQVPELYEMVDHYQETCLAEMSEYAQERHVVFSYEQMYTPTQGMWTIDQCINRMKNVYGRAKAPMYITIDTAHQASQHLFLKPTLDDICRMQDEQDTSLFNLPKTIVDQVLSGEEPVKIYRNLDKFAYMFAEPADSDLFEWFSSLGCYSPIVHLQQTDGTYSAHKPFTKANNQTGIVKPKDVFRAIAKSYETTPIAGLPPRVRDIYLTFEIFFSVAQPVDVIIREMRESVEYWREYIPVDGMTLDKLIYGDGVTDS